MMADLTPEKDGVVVHNMDDDVIRGATVTFKKEITYPPPPPKVQAIAAKSQEKPIELTPEEIKVQEAEAFKAQTKQQVILLATGALLTLGLGLIAPVSFMQHFIVFVLSVFVGFQVIWNVSHALHTPLMAVTNAISGIIIIGALLQLGSPNNLVGIIWKGKYRGQKQKWFITKFIGNEKEINLQTNNPEFIDWKWIKMDELPEVIVDFKKKMYVELLKIIKDFID